MLRPWPGKYTRRLSWVGIRLPGAKNESTLQDSPDAIWDLQACGEEPNWPGEASPASFGAPNGAHSRGDERQSFPPAAASYCAEEHRALRQEFGRGIAQRALAELQTGAQRIAELLCCGRRRRSTRRTEL